MIQNDKNWCKNYIDKFINKLRLNDGPKCVL